MWQEGGPEVHSCTILTTGANDLLASVHNRMPVILDSENYDFWLDPDVQEKDSLTGLLKPYPSEALQAYPVSRFVNSPSNDDPRCVEPAA